MGYNESPAKSPAGLLAAPVPLTLIVLVSFLLMNVPGSNKTGAPATSKATTDSEAISADSSSVVPSVPALQLLRDYLGLAPSVAPLPTAAVPSRTAVIGDTKAPENADRPQPSETVAVEGSVTKPTGENADSKGQPTSEFDRLEAELKTLHDPYSSLGTDGLKCMIAMVPDPMDSHFPLTFDNAISSLHQAFRDHGYVRDRQVFLWQYASKAESAAKDKDKAANSTPWRTQPSAILFRRTKSQPTRPGEKETQTNDVVLLLLVGETPTTGVQKLAFYRALEFAIANELSKARPEETIQIPIIGPTFSGSSSSVSTSIHQWWRSMARHLHARDAKRFANTQVKLNFISGSATSQSNQPTLTFELDEKPGPRLSSSFFATVLPDQAVHELLLTYLTDFQEIRPERIAVLSEDTAYGQGNSSVKSPNEKLNRVRTIPFPLSLSRMRSEYQKSEKAATAAGDTGNNKINSQRRNVTLESEAASRAIDTLPTFSSVTPATADLAMAQILGTIKQEEIQAVGIVATDVQDVLFLARQIRMYSPDVLLFTTENEVLYTHSDLTGALRGMLVASTYPLSTRVDGWYCATPGQHTSLAFPSSSAQGIYNSTIAQLNGLTPGDKAWLRQPFHGYQLPLSEKEFRPALWLSVVTETGIWPIAVRPLEKMSESQEAMQYVLTAPDVAHNYYSLVSLSRVPSLCFALLGALFLSVPWLRRYGLRKQSGWGRWLARNLPPVDYTISGKLDRLHFHRLIVMAVILWTIALAECLLLAPLLMYWSAWCWLPGCRPFSVSEYISVWHFIADLLIFGMCVCVWLACLGFNFYFVLQLRKANLVGKTVGSRWRNIAMLIGLMLGLIFILFVGLRPLFASNLERVLFLDRAGELNSGISPILPMVSIIAAIMIWSIFYCLRSYTVEECRLEPPIPATECPANAIEAGSTNSRKSSPNHEKVIQLATADIGQRLASLRDAVGQIMATNFREHDLLFCGLVLINALYLVFHWINTFEGLVFDAVFLCLCGVGLVMFLVIYLHLKTICQQLLRLLRALALHPILLAFEQAPQRVRDKVSDQLFCTLPDESDLSQKMRFFLKACDELHLPQAKHFVEKYHGVELERTDADESNNSTARMKRSDLNRDLAEFSQNNFMGQLQRYWIDRDCAPHVVPSKSNSGQKETTAVTISDVELFMAVELLTIIRCTFVFMRNYLIGLVGMLLCFMTALQSYPFVIRNSLQFGLTWITIWVAGSLVILMVQFNRNEVLSRLSNSTPNKFELDRGFIQSILTYVALPLFGILTIQFPGLTRFLFGWLSGLSQFVSM